MAKVDKVSTGYEYVLRLSDREAECLRVLLLCGLDWVTLQREADVDFEYLYDKITEALPESTLNTLYFPVNKAIDERCRDEERDLVRGFGAKEDD